MNTRRRVADLRYRASEHLGACATESPVTVSDHLWALASFVQLTPRTGGGEAAPPLWVANENGRIPTSNAVFGPSRRTQLGPNTQTRQGVHAQACNVQPPWTPIRAPVTHLEASE